MVWRMWSVHVVSHRMAHATSDSHMDSVPSSPSQRSVSTYARYHTYPAISRKATLAIVRLLLLYLCCSVVPCFAPFYCLCLLFSPTGFILANPTSPAQYPFGLR